MIRDEIYTYMRRILKGNGTIKHYELYYKLELDGKFTEKWFNKNLQRIADINGIPAYQWNGDPGNNEDKIQLQVLSTTNQDQIERDGVIKILNIPRKDPGDYFKVTMQLVDAGGGPINGNGSVTHYGDGD